MLKKAREFLAKIRKELGEKKEAHPIVQANGITLTFDYEKEKLGYVPGSSSTKSYDRFPIKFLEDKQKIKNNKLMEFIFKKIGEGLDDFVLIIIKRQVIRNSAKAAGRERARQRFAGKSKKEISDLMKKMRRGKSVP